VSLQLKGTSQAECCVPSKMKLYVDIAADFNTIFHALHHTPGYIPPAAVIASQ